MNILSARIDWNEEFDNPANLVVRVDELPLKELRYERKGGYLFAEHQGYVSFFYDDPRDHRGYGGREFKLAMKDGTEVTLVGPWSGNPAGAAAAGFPRSYDCVFEAPSKWGGQGAYSGQLTEPVWLETLRKFCPDAEVAQVPAFSCCPTASAEQNLVIGCVASSKPTGWAYEIVRKGMSVGQTLAFKRAKRYTRYMGEVRDSRSMYSKPKENQIRMAGHANELIAKNDLTKFGLKLIDLNNLPPLLPEEKQDVCFSMDPESDEGSY